VVAATLAGAGRDVLLIEEGQNLPQDSCAPFSYAEMKQKYRSGGITAAFGKLNVAYAEGSCVGGGSEVNSGLYHRTPARVIEEWVRDYEVADMSQAAMDPWFEACEEVMRPTGYPDELPVSSDILRRGAERIGMSGQDVPRLVEFSPERDEQGTEKSSRRSMTKTFLPLFFAAGGKLLPETRVAKLQKRGKHWQINAENHQHGPLQIEADHVFVCAGAIHSPALLRRSGITTNVGDTLALQPMVKLTAEFAEPVNFFGMGIAGEQVKPDPDYSFGCAISSPAHLAINLAGEPDGPRFAVKRYRHLISYYVMARGTVNGSVRNLPGFNDPFVRYPVSAPELANLGRGVRELAKVLLAAGATQVFTGLNELPRIGTDSEADQLPASLSTTADNVMTIHLMSSCPMGENRSRTAVDSFGRVHGHQGLYVSDVSTVCNSLGVNPQGTIMALARRNSEHFLNN
jgi:choline dehydrogenase-like flavoprotein